MKKLDILDIDEKIKGMGRKKLEKYAKLYFRGRANFLIDCIVIIDHSNRGTSETTVLDNPSEINYENINLMLNKDENLFGIPYFKLYRDACNGELDFGKINKILEDIDKQYPKKINLK